MKKKYVKQTLTLKELDLKTSIFAGPIIHEHIDCLNAVIEQFLNLSEKWEIENEQIIIVEWLNLHRLTKHGVKK